ncbi:hypothetical protein C9374_006976 [Naegleria lovaniensis]|uniref:Uncharacterized protein n=1 Tax=Naegleria lovaniensis TaxID=51637 RepID=A0AA88KXS6_NAELO|nr:uncharacterized protein C9374_006976 [Naegleria lovaniensis]KAG2393445.1 hypothetical protein C9374_006976 [Naegleria lovaniensis]
MPMLDQSRYSPTKNLIFHLGSNTMTSRLILFILIASIFLNLILLMMWSTHTRSSSSETTTTTTTSGTSTSVAKVASDIREDILHEEDLKKKPHEEDLKKKQQVDSPQVIKQGVIIEKVIEKPCPYASDWKGFAQHQFKSKDKSEMWNILKFMVSQEEMNHHLRNGVNRDPINFGVPHIVTATSRDYFDRLENFVGSIHRLYSNNKVNTQQINPQVASPPTHPNDKTITKIGQTFKSQMRSNYWLVWNSVTTSENRPILVYDLGLTQEQRDQVKTWKNVELVPIHFDLLPDHFRNLITFAWKPLAMYLALQRFPSIIFLDSGVELWNRLDRVEDILLKKGHFHVVQEGLHTSWKCCGTVGELTHDGSFNYLNLKRADYHSKEMCSGGIQGYIRGAYSYRNVLIPTLECAWDEKCITPPGSSLANHRQDQSIFSLHIHKAGITCEKDVRLWGNPGNRDGVPDHEIVIYLRKGDRTKPYISHVEKKKKFATVIPFIERQLVSVLQNIEIWNTPYYEPCNDMFQDEEYDSDLIFYSNKKRNDKLEEKILEKINAGSTGSTKHPILKCFRNVVFKYADLTADRDKYPNGPTNQFYDLIHDPTFYSEYDHFFYMEPDCRAIRPNWLDAVKSITKEYSISKPDFWYIGSNYRGDYDLGDQLQTRYHINGNAIYSTDVAFRSFLKHVDSIFHFSYDTDPFVFLFNPKHYDFTKHIWNRIIFHDFVQNWWHADWNEKSLRDLYPRTYFVHGGKKD